MNVLPNGTFTVITATIVASSLILFFGNSAVADSDEKKSNELLLINEAAVKTTSNIGVSSDGNAHANAQVGDINKALLVSPPPPPGPFLVEESVKRSISSMSESISQIQTMTIAIVNGSAPKPVAPSFEIGQPKLDRDQPRQATSTSMPEFKKMQPSISSEPVALIVNPLIESGKLEQIKQIASPVQKDVKLNSPEKPVNTTQVPTRNQNIIEQKSKLEVNTVEPSEPPSPDKEIKEPILKKVVVQAPKEKLSPSSNIEIALSPLVQPVTDRAMPSEPIWMKQPPISPTWPIAQYQNRQAPAQIMPNNMNFPPRMNQQYMYVPMPANRLGLTYPPMMNSGYYNYGPNFGMPQIPIGINSQMKTLDPRELNNTEIK